MLFKSDVNIELAPDFGALDDALVHLGRGFLALGFEAVPCADLLARAVADGLVDERFVDVHAPLEGGLVFRREALFPDIAEWRFVLARPGPPPRALDMTLEADGFAGACELVRASLADDREAFRSRLSEAQLAHFEPFLGGPARDDGAARTLAADVPRAHGIHRREHASLLVQSETTSVLVDPVHLLKASSHRSIDLSRPPAPDAILVTHGHDDHWHLPSLLDAAVSKSIPVIVPDVPRRTLLHRSIFRDELELAGQAARVVQWGTVVTVGDISIEVLPFFGEQPTRDAPGPGADLRSWGNCYVLRTPAFSLLLLVDAGADPQGDMRDVVRAVVERSGPIDIVASCLREFDSPFFGGLDYYWAALPFSRLSELHRAWKTTGLPSTTAGRAGAADICALAKARYFLPYAHGYAGAGAPITDISWGAGDVSEEEAVRGVAALAPPSLVCVSWNPGDHVTVVDGRLSIVPYDAVATNAR